MSVSARLPYIFFSNAPDSVSLLQADSLPSVPMAGVIVAPDSVAADSAAVDSVAVDSTQAVVKKDTIPSMLDRVSIGVPSDPAPYMAGNDNLVSSLLMGGLLLSFVAVAVSGRFIARQTKNFFYLENEHTTTVPDTAGELTGQGVLVAFAALLLGVAYYCYSVAGRGVGGYWVDSSHTLLGVYLAAIVAYFLFKILAYQFVNWVFFDVKKNEQWNKSQLFLTAMEGVVLTPIVMLMVYGDVSLQILLLALIIVVLIVKILTFYKCYLIFFRRFGAFLQIILYFCALEMIPLVVLLGLMETFNNNLEINF